MQTLFLYITTILLVFSILYLVVKLRTKYINNKNKELELLVENKTSELTETIKNIRVAKKNLRTKVYQQKKLIGTISHDIKSPLKYLTIGIKKIEQELQEIDNEELKKLSHSLSMSSEALLNFVNNLVDYSKIVLDDSLEEQEFIDADIIANDIMNLYKDIAEEKKIKLVYRNLSNKTILLSEKLTKILISNLLDNAIKNTNNGTIEVNLNLKKDKIYFEISDTGTGISENMIKYYMNLFSNNDSIKFSFQNNGLGLYMIIEIIHLLNGDLKIEENKPNGTVISIVVDSKINTH